MTEDSGRGYWERHARRYDVATRILARPIAPMLELVADAVRGRARVLEVGAGTGLVTTTIARVAGEVVATDYADAMVEKLADRVRSASLANVRCERGDIYALPYAGRSFDAVVAANVLHLVPDLPAALAALRRMLRPGGVLVAPSYCHAEHLRAKLVSRVFALSGFPGQRRFTAQTLCDALEAAALVLRRKATLPGLIPIAYVEATPSPAS